MGQPFYWAILARNRIILIAVHIKRCQLIGPKILLYWVNVLAKPLQETMIWHAQQYWNEPRWGACMARRITCCARRRECLTKSHERVKLPPHWQWCVVLCWWRQLWQWQHCGEIARGLRWKSPAAVGDDEENSEPIVTHSIARCSVQLLQHCQTGLQWQRSCFPWCLYWSHLVQSPR